MKGFLFEKCTRGRLRNIFPLKKNVKFKSTKSAIIHIDEKMYENKMCDTFDIFIFI